MGRSLSPLPRAGAGTGQDGGQRRAPGAVLSALTPAECAHYIAHAGYGSAEREKALT